MSYPSNSFECFTIDALDGKMQVSDLDELQNEAYEHENICKEITRLYHDTVIPVHLNSLVDQKTKEILGRNAKCPFLRIHL